MPDLYRLGVRRGCDRILVDEPGLVGDGGNSGFQAVNLAVQAGASPVILVGFDLRLDLGHHWHGKHPPGLNNPQHRAVAHWRRALDGAAGDLADHGVEVLNASPVSTLSAFPIVSLEEALAC